MKLTLITKSEIPDRPLGKFYTEKAMEICQITSSSELTEDESHIIFTFDDDQGTDIFNFIEKNHLIIIRMRPYYES